MLKEDEILLNYIEDKKRQCEEQYMLTSTAFLDIRQLAIAENELRYTRHLSCGGYGDAERRVIVFLPDYADTDAPLSEDDNPLALLRVSIPKGGKKLTHRDYLGSLLSLGIDRNVTGDILVRDDGADIVILKSIAEYLLANYSAAGHTRLSCEVLPISKLDRGSIKTEYRRDTVASMRLDNIVSSVFPMARGKAQEAINSGIVFVNNIQCTKADRQVDCGDKIVLRGKGKAVIKECGSPTKKGRIPVTYEVYK